MYQKRLLKRYNNRKNKRKSKNKKKINQNQHHYRMMNNKILTQCFVIIMLEYDPTLIHFIFVNI